MAEIRRILCPVDFSAFSVRAYRHALSLAQRYQAELLVLCIVEPWRHPCSGFIVSAGHFAEFFEQLFHNAETQLQEFVTTHADNNTPSQCIVQEGMASDCILDFAEARKTDLIVMGTHGRRGFDRLMLGSVTERVMRKASCPVLIIHKPSHDLTGSVNEQHPVHFNRILFCTDFSENSKHALAYAFSLSARYSTELILLHVLENIPGSVTIDRAIAAATDQLDRLIPSDMRESVRNKAMVRVGKPYEQIIQLALESQTDIVVMAVCSRNVMDLAVFGSTTHRVIRLGPCPVLAVPV